MSIEDFNGMVADLKAEVARLTKLEKGIARLLIYKDGYIPITTDDALVFIKLVFDNETLARIAQKKAEAEVARLTDENTRLTNTLQNTTRSYYP